MVDDVTKNTQKAGATNGNGARAAFDEATRGITFTKDFNSAVEALIVDPLATYGQRFLAWLKRRSWGNYRLYAVTEDGDIATQADAERELGVDKRIISNLVRFYERRGYLYREGKAMYPVLSPQFDPNFQKVTRSSDFLEFMESWKVTHSTDFQELEVARSTVERLRKVILSEYQKSQRARTNGVPTLYESGRVSESNTTADERAPLENGTPPLEDTLARTPQEDSQKLLGRRRHDAPDWHDRVANYLEILPIPTVLDKPMLMQITEMLSEDLVEPFEAATDPKKGTKYAATSKDGKGIRNWAGVLSIAKQVAARNATTSARLAEHHETANEDKQAKEIEDWKWIAENDEDPEARDYANKKLLEHGVSLAREAAT